MVAMAGPCTKSVGQVLKSMSFGMAYSGEVDDELTMIMSFSLT